MIDEEGTSSESDSHWIEVESLATPPDPHITVGSRSLEIPLRVSVNKRKQSIVDRYMSLYEKAHMLNMHSTHLMLLLVRLQLASRVCSEQLLQSYVLSLLPQQLTEQSHSTLQNTLLWFRLEYPSLAEQLDTEVLAYMARYQLRDIHSLASLLRALGYRTRLVHNMLPVSVSKQRQKQRTRGASREQLSTSCSRSPYFQTAVPVPKQSDRRKRRSVERTKGATDPCASEEEFQTPEKKKRRMPKAESVSMTAGEYTDEWLEVRIEGAWIPVHPKLCSITEPYRCAQLATPGSLMYIVACEEGRLRDVSARYCLGWGGKYMKLRPDNETWENILSLYSHSQWREEEAAEEKLLMRTQLSLPLPSTLSDFKCNPLYLLERNLLKFQAIYPVDTQPVGSYRGDRVFLKEHVALLHTRENWLKEGRVICRGSSACKLVRGRIKPGTDSKSEREIELFGRWQTEMYSPHPVVDGKIPKNEFGNVELFQLSMLPKGAAHVDVPGSANMSRKLGIDYALAMVGWEFHGIACHPLFRGVVVAAENEQLLLEACKEVELAKREKERETRERKVFERWRRVIRSVLIRQRVCQKYKLDEV